MPVTMEIIVSEGRDRDIYPGSAPVRVSSSLPEYQGGATMTLRFAPKLDPKPLPEISVDPNIAGGLPCVARTLPIAHILEKLASGHPVERIMGDYADLTLADIQLALETAAWVMRDPAIDWASLNLQGMVDLQHELRGWQRLSDDALGFVENSVGE